MTYMAFGCREVNVFDDAATATRARAGMSRSWISCTPRTPATPITQPAGQWWDATDWPDSAGFAGFLVTRVDGLWGPSGYTREATQLASKGRARTGTLKRANHTGRTITIEGTAYGRNCCSTAYGINALAQILRNGCTCRTTDTACTCRDSSSCSCGSGGCGGDTLRVFDDRPRTAACDGVIPSTSDIWYNLKGVAVVEGPTLIAPDSTGCGCGCRAEQQFRVVLSSTDPHLYQDPKVLVTAGGLTAASGCVPNPDFWCGPQITSPASDFVGGLPPAPMPPQPASYACLPPFIGTTYSTIDVGTTIFDTFLNLSLTAGSALRAVTFKWWRKQPAITPPNAVYSADTACGAITISHLEAGATIAIDSTCGSASVTLADGTKLNADHRIFTSGGRPWAGSVELGCGQWVLGVIYDARDTTTGTTFNISTVQGLP